MLSYLEISKENLLHNFKLIKSLVRPEVKIAAVIKANAYGHGQNEVAEILEDCADYFQVDDARELAELRKVSRKPILVLGYVGREEMPEAIQNEGILSVYDAVQIENLNRAAEKLNVKVNVHVKIDACLGRQGALLAEIPQVIQSLKKSQNLILQGAYSHFANIEDTSDFSHAQKQLDVFAEALALFKQGGWSDLLTHISASSGIMVYEKEQNASSLVRAGISLYGMWPSQDLRNNLESPEFKLKPAARWVTHLAQVKTLPANYSIGYGLTFVTPGPMKVAVVPQGYSDGYDRGLSGVGEVLIGGARCRVLGRVAMNMFVVDVTHLAQVAAEDEVVLLGSQAGECITAEEIAAHLGTINYEITTRILATLPRIVK